MKSPKQHFHAFRTRVGAATVLALLLGAASTAVAARSTHVPTDALAQASEIAEQLSENAPSIDGAAFKKAMADIDALAPPLASALPPDRKKALNALLTGIRDAWAAGDRSAVGVHSIDAYRLLQEAIPRGPKAVPVQVAQLDYVGLKVNALLSSSSVTWNQVSATVREASTWWSAIEPRVGDATLKEAIRRALLGMQEAADQKDSRLMHFAADMELILVDGLEAFFTKHPPPR